MPTADASQFESLAVEIEGQVATISIVPLRDALTKDPPADVHMELPTALEELARNNDVRVIILTGANENEFCVPVGQEFYSDPAAAKRFGDPYRAYNLISGIGRCMRVMTEIEKPIVAKVNGDAIGFGQSLVFASDIIVACEDAILSDVHMSMGEISTSAGTSVGIPFGTVPGDGAGALLPLFMTPTRAKEYQLLGQALTAKELGEMRIFNHVVPADELDAATDALVQRLLSRSAIALALTKRVMNRHVAAQLNLAMDAGLGYEMMVFSQISALGFDGDPTRLKP